MFSVSEIESFICSTCFLAYNIWDHASNMYNFYMTSLEFFPWANIFILRLLNLILESLLWTDPCQDVSISIENSSNRWIWNRHLPFFIIRYWSKQTNTSWAHLGQRRTPMSPLWALSGLCSQDPYSMFMWVQYHFQAHKYGPKRNRSRGLQCNLRT